jgi:hypothetical protein
MEVLSLSRKKTLLVKKVSHLGMAHVLCIRQGIRHKVDVDLSKGVLMRVLVGCEFSGRVRDAFLRRGIDAVSVDLLGSESSYGPHITGDILDVAQSQHWDMLIAFPPFTCLASSGIHWNSRIPGRWEKSQKATLLVEKIFHLPIPKIAIENPVGIISRWMKPTQIIQPWQFGHGETKATCLWLKGLPCLTPTEIVSGRDRKILNVKKGPDRQRIRSLTYQGIAEAMASQWGGIANE